MSEEIKKAFMKAYKEQYSDLIASNKDWLAPEEQIDMEGTHTNKHFKTFKAAFDHQQKRIDDAIELIDTFSGMPDSSEDLNQLINQVREALKENKECT